MRPILCALALSAALVPATASAFCGFYIEGDGEKLFNNATQVILMRDGTRTVLTMQNNYQGPPKDFAMVIPVPVVLQKENVKTLAMGVFDKIDQLDSPRLVEYWEQDPCYVEPPEEEMAPMSAAATDTVSSPKKEADKLGVKIEAQFAVGEYDVVILSAQDSGGLDTWLRQQKYNIPAGAEPYLRPYVQAGSKFFVAKVDPKKVKFEGNMAALSPLRFHYDTTEFSLPVRLGLINAQDKQDLIVHILARGQRYEAANYKNVTIPTNLDVAEETRGKFAPFYAALFDATVEKNKGAIVTEYSWDASSCDPCPGPALDPSDIATFGGDAIPGLAQQGMYGFTLTRLHARYDKSSLGADIVFAAAPPIVGGREVTGANGKLEHGARADSINNFQGRYAIRHPWTGPIACKNPVRGRWGGPPAGLATASSQPMAARKIAFAPRGNIQLASMVKSDVPELSITPQTGSRAAGEVPTGAPKSGGCAGCSTTGENVAPIGVIGFLLLALTRRKKK